MVRHSTDTKKNLKAPHAGVDAFNAACVEPEAMLAEMTSRLAAERYDGAQRRTIRFYTTLLGIVLCDCWKALSLSIFPRCSGIGSVDLRIGNFSFDSISRG